MGGLDPYTPPADSESVPEHAPRAVATWPDLLLTLSLGIVLLQAILGNVWLWFLQLNHLGIYDPSLGRDPASIPHPFLAPLLVCLVALARLGLKRLRFVAPGYRWALLIIAAVAALTAIAARISEPEFSWAPTSLRPLYFPLGSLPSTPFT
ncbi:MAG TPA: hypothetical protein VER96_27525 [Polyangiaceae bacterium]|nr:hypothetical protein [Polyangiaceae bacterium]